MVFICKMESLSEEIIIMIFNNLVLCDLCSMVRINHTFNRIITDPSFWKNKLILDYSVLPEDLEEISFFERYLDFYHGMIKYINILRDGVYFDRILVRMNFVISDLIEKCGDIVFDDNIYVIPEYTMIYSTCIIPLGEYYDMEIIKETMRNKLSHTKFEDLVGITLNIIPGLFRIRLSITIVDYNSNESFNCGYIDEWYESDMKVDNLLDYIREHRSVTSIQGYHPVILVIRDFYSYSGEDDITDNVISFYLSYKDNTRVIGDTLSKFDKNKLHGSVILNP